MSNPATQSIDTPEYSPNFITGLPVAAGVTLFVGTMSALDDAGNLNPASDTPNLRVLGRQEPSIDGVSGDIVNTGGAAGALLASVKRGVFAFNNSVGDPVGPLQVNRMVYVEDNQTVNATGGVNKVVAGRLVGFSNIDGRPLIDFSQRPTTESTPV